MERCASEEYAGSFVINPDLREVEECDLNLIVAGTDEAVVMVEGDAQEISEVDLLEALDIAHQEIKRICEAQKELQKLAGREKRVVTPPVSLDELKRAVSEMALEKITKRYYHPR